MNLSALLAFGLISSAACRVTCGLAGYDLAVKAYFYSGDGSLANFAACSARCQTESQCLTFAFGGFQCLLYSVPLDSNFRSQDNSPFLFYDRNCTNPAASSIFTTLLTTVARNITSGAPSQPTTTVSLGKGSAPSPPASSAPSAPSTPSSPFSLSEIASAVRSQPGVPYISPTPTPPTLSFRPSNPTASTASASAASSILSVTVSSAPVLAAGGLRMLALPYASALFVLVCWITDMPFKLGDVP